VHRGWLGNVDSKSERPFLITRSGQLKSAISHTVPPVGQALVFVNGGYEYRLKCEHHSIGLVHFVFEGMLM
jgi:hypothetical protein